MNIFRRLVFGDFDLYSGIEWYRMITSVFKASCRMHGVMWFYWVSTVTMPTKARFSWDLFQNVRYMYWKKKNSKNFNWYWNYLGFINYHRNSETAKIRSSWKLNLLTHNWCMLVFWVLFTGRGIALMFASLLILKPKLGSYILHVSWTSRIKSLSLYFIWWPSGIYLSIKML